MLELGAPVVGKWAAVSPRDGPDSPRRKSKCGPDDGTKGDTGPRLTFEQGKAEFAAWCTVSAPLVLGFDTGNTTEYDRWFPILSNKRALAVQADWAGLAGRLIAQSDENVTTVVPHGASCEDMKDTRALPAWTVWGKPLTGGRYAVAAINTMADAPATISIPLVEFGLGKKTAIEVDVWTGAMQQLPSSRWEATLPQGSGTHVWKILQPREELK
eukprot:SAG31_NODE_1600_length_7791_cov_15.201508_5_plen_214_part_00